MQKISSKKHTIDAEGVVFGRLASRIAVLLMGKERVGYRPYEDRGGSVEVINAAKIKFTGRKLDEKVYYHHTMHPGGLKTKTMKTWFEKDPSAVLKYAVAKMLPKNKLRNNFFKRLTILP